VSNYAYPTTDWDRAKNLLALLGSFWYEMYYRRDQMETLCAAKGQIENQTLVDLMHAVDCLAYRTCPVFQIDNWYILRLLESERNTTDLALPIYDGSIAYDAGFRYDVPGPQPAFVFPVPANLSVVGQIFNRFTDPSLVWSNGIDFTLDPGRIVFREDPFLDGRVGKRAVYLNGEIIDQEAVLWIFRGEFDAATLYRQYGYVLNMQFPSSKVYRDLLTAFFDALVGGTTAHQILLAASAITGIPLVVEPVEVVEQVSWDGTGRLVITDQHSYKFPMTATPLVAVGDTVQAGDSLVDTLQVIELNRGIVPDDLRALAMGPGFLATCYYGDLIFENKEVPLEVIEDHPSGFTYVKFGLGGFPLDVTRFFDDMHERGIAASQMPVDDCDPGQTVLIPGDECDGEGTPDQVLRRGTLAHLLDVRENPIGEPTAASLPDSINPLEFLVQNVLRANATILKIKAGSLAADRLGLHASTQFRKIVPPHTVLILLIELTAASEVVDAEEFVETVELFTMMNLTDEVADSVTEKFSLKLISGTCQ
jgi:hypothetical protein